MKTLYAAAALALTAPVAAEAAPVPQRVTVTMQDDGFVPRVISLRPGRPYLMRFINPSGRTHDFEAGPFFNLAQVTDGGDAIRDNKLTLPPGGSVTIRLVAPPRSGARFTYRSRQIEDVASGLKGYIYIR